MVTSKTQQIEDLLELQVKELVETCAIMRYALFPMHCEHFFSKLS